MDFTAIDRVGIEIEGGWVTRPANAAHHDDGSVRNVLGVNGATIDGEMVSAPMSTWQSVQDWIYATYPVSFNRSCGIHVHVSFKERRSYAQLMSIEFYEYFLARMQAWGERTGLPQGHLFWERLDGLNNFCKKEFRADRQVPQRYKAGEVRYTHLNYCFLVHGTIECRLAPVFKMSRIAVSYVEELCTIYEDFLRTNKSTEIVHTIEDLG